MTLHQIKVSGYRGFATPQTLNLAVPNGKPGSGLTLIVGSNNSGKSSLIEILHFLRAPGQPVNFVEGQKNARTNGQVRLAYSTSEGDFSIETGAVGVPAWVNLPATIPKTNVYIVPPRRSIDTFSQSGPQDRDVYSREMQDFAPRRQIASNFSSRLANIDSWREKYFGLLGRILPNTPSWYLERNDNGNQFMKVSNSTSPHSSDGLGSGTASAIHIADALYDSQVGQIIGIDEPELSLHPAAQRRLASILVELSADRQIVIATHSPFFVPFELMASGMKLARVYLSESGSVIGQVEEATLRKLSNLVQDSNNPHVMGLDAREVLFLEDDVILVEGQEDVIGYRRLLSTLGKDVPASFFGWGVGGASKMVVIASLLKDLGIQRVFGILDSDKREVSKELSMMFPSYKFVTIPAPDIRTKPARKATESKEGLLGENGELRPKYEKDMTALFAVLEQYFVRKS